MHIKKKKNSRFFLKENHCFKAKQQTLILHRK